jgi:hypothetical protein
MMSGEDNGEAMHQEAQDTDRHRSGTDGLRS